MPTSAPPYSGVASVFSTCCRIASYIFFRHAPGRVLPPFIVLFYSIYALAYWLGSLQAPAPEKSKLEVVKGNDSDRNDNTTVTSRRRATDKPHYITVPLTLPSSSLILRRISFVLNSVLVFLVVDYVSKPYFQPAHDLQFARVGAVDSTSVKIIARYPASSQPSPTTTTYSTSTPSPTPSITEAIHDTVDGRLPEITLPAAVEEVLAPAPTSHTTSLRVQWRNAVLVSSALDSPWTDGPIIEMTESRDWVVRLVELNGTRWSSPEKILSFHTTPDPRLARGSHFRFVSTSCVVPNFPYSVFVENTYIKGYELLADHIWATSSQVNNMHSNPAPIEFLMMMGDFIYADVPYYFGDTIQAFRRLYRRVYASKSFRRIYERLPTYNIYDDHEFINNFGANGSDSYRPYLNASRAYEIYNGQANPENKTKGIYYYDFRHGDTAFFVMDTRRYRTPTAPREPYRFPINLFTPLVDAIAAGKNPFVDEFGEPNAPPNPIVEGVNSTTRTMLGEEQLAALHSWIADVNQTATWKFVVSSVPLTAMWAGYDGHLDLWAGYMHERNTVLSLLSSVPNVVVLSGDRHEFAAVEFPRGKYLVREYSTSPLNQFSNPWPVFGRPKTMFGYPLPIFGKPLPVVHTLNAKNARKINLIRKKVVTTETGEERVEESAEEIEEETLVKYIPDGNHKWTTIEVDSKDSNAPTLKVEVYINGKLKWEQNVIGDPVELTHSTTLVIPAQVQKSVESPRHSLKGWSHSH
ncbi:unnamed protein product [Rhizoctonia solani]|uniref:PhoD-like phosphatase metallophosphatase domain-containing protein n=1 Tax=Rhizoctonia solani TaxID=456999 RepID=A0A8H2X1V0_9AGAM|nr:unnamed protein product [Rhizoctonia solani]CAE6436903.1 unnamed protein product [Rhizoctonia solani]